MNDLINNKISAKNLAVDRSDQLRMLTRITWVHQTLIKLWPTSIFLKENCS